MNIDSQNSTNPLYPRSTEAQKASDGQPAGPQTPAGQSTAGDTVDLSALRKLREEPEIRPDVVAKGKELLNDPNYPSPEIVDAIAKLITPFADDE